MDFYFCKIGFCHLYLEEIQNESLDVSLQGDIQAQLAIFEWKQDL